MRNNRIQETETLVYNRLPGASLFVINSTVFTSPPPYNAFNNKPCVASLPLVLIQRRIT